MTFEESISALERIAAADAADSSVNPQAATRVFAHGRRTERALLLLHGFTNSPRQMSDLGELAFERGWNVYIPRLPYHGLSNRMTNALAGLREADLKTAASESVAAASQLGERLDVLGFSMGGVVAAWLGQTHDLHSVTAIAPFMGLKLTPHGLSAKIGETLAAVPNAWLWWNIWERAAQLPMHAYPRYPTHAVAELLRLGQDVLRRAVTKRPRAAHCSIIVNRGDPSQNNSVSRHLANLWSASGARCNWREMRGLGWRHDVMDPTTYPSAARLVYPIAMDALDSHT
jgi:esterase/lipase